MIQKNKVFCLGFSKTGTTSLEYALKSLGYNVCHGHWQSNYTFYLLALWIHRDYEELLRMTRYWDAFADGPWGGTELYVKLVEHYPNAKYVLTERDPESWYDSFEKLITMFDPNPETALASYHDHQRYGSGYYFESIFGITKLAGHKDKIIGTYTAHNRNVKEFFEAKDIELLSFDVSSEPNVWQLLCPFLGMPAPNVPFPHFNKATDNPHLSAQPPR